METLQTQTFITKEEISKVIESSNISNYIKIDDLWTMTFLMKLCYMAAQKEASYWNKHD